MPFDPITFTACGRTFRVHPACAAFPLLDGDKLAALVADVRKHGLHEPITVDGDELLDGRNRLRACDLAGVAPRFAPWRQNGASKTDWIVSLNLRRRHLNGGQCGMLAVALLPIYEAEARERQRAAGVETQRRKADPQAQLTEILPEAVRRGNEAREQAGAAVGVSGRTVSDAKRVAEADPALAAQVLSGTVSLPKAVATVKRREAEANLEAVATKEAKAAEGVFDVIVVDPPWPMQKITRDVRPNQSAPLDYPTMSIDEIQAIRLPTADACHVWLWTTQRFLPDAFRLLDAWGLAYVCTFVWHKPGGFQPVGLPQFNCEFALYARKGTPAFADTKALPTCFDADRGAHSEKPEAFYDVVRRVTLGRRLDMFNRRPIQGFDGWGKEAAP